jgi:hypothetical protein
MDERRIDLSSLDPARDPERFERMVRAVLDRADAPPPHPFAGALVARGRIAVLAAAALAALAWVPALTGIRAGVNEATGTDAVATLAGWAQAGSIPEGVDLFQTLGGTDGR